MKNIVLMAVAVMALASMVSAQATGTTPGSTDTSSPAQSSASGDAQTAPNPAAQAAPNSGAPQAGTNAGAAGGAAQGAIAAGTAINAELRKGIDSKKAKEGDAVEAKVVQDVVSGGKVIVPRNSKLMGHLTQVKAGGKGEASSLGIAFDKAVLKGGQEVPFHAVIQALAPAPRMPAAGAYAGGGDEGGMSSMGAAQPGGYNTTGGAAMGGASAPAGAANSTMGGMQGTSGNNAPNTSAAPNTAPNAAGNNGPGMTTSGQLTPASRGVMGLPGLMLEGGGEGASGSTISNQKNNVKLDGGTQLVLRVTAQ